MEELIKYLGDNKIGYKPVDDDLILINEELHYLVRPDEEGLLFTEDLILIADEPTCVKYVYNFGGNWYWENKEDYDKPKLNELKYIGKAVDSISTDHFLGVRGTYEILNGSRLYEDWCKKAKFLGCTALGICEKNTLAGLLKFQLECQKNKIKPILGATYTVFREEADFKYDIKVYVQDETGWKNLLAINKEVNVVNHKFIKEDRFVQLLDGLTIVVDPKSLPFDRVGKLARKSIIDYYQLDSVEFTNNDRDKEYLENLKKYVRSDFHPIAITDAFYLDKEHSHIKRTLNAISGVRESESNNQYFKSKDEYCDEIESLFSKEDESFYNIFGEALNAEYNVTQKCNFLIETSNKYLPKYIMTEEEKEKYGDNLSMFWSLIGEGLDKKVDPKRVDEYIDQIQKEYEIIEYGNLQDYFLINWEQTQWCKQSNILTGLSRGSASGFQTSNILDITKIDPFDYNLIAERFLTKQRAKDKIADIDIDHEQGRKEEVKFHLIDKYGFDQCCSVGTYGTFQIKGGLKDIAKIKGVSFSEVNYVSSILDAECKEWVDVFRVAAKNSRLKAFIYQYSDVISELFLILNAKRNCSTHASAFIITPSDKTIYEWMPVKLDPKAEVPTLISEWEGVELEEAGFLKQDILGLLQLDKFHKIIDLIKENQGIDIDIYDVPLDCRKTLSYFSKGWNNDVFQFGAKGLSSYCTSLKPQSINDLIATIALYRPGPMENNFHNEYILRKSGDRAVEYYSGTEEILKKTYGLIVYQEDVMQICQKLAGFDLAETDDVRKCLHEDTFIWTSEGYIQIKNLIKKSKILTFSDLEYKNKLNSVNRVFSSGVKDCVKLTLVSGRELICTKDHRIYTSKGWVNAENSLNSFVLHELEEKYGTHRASLHKLYLIIALVTEGAIASASACFVNQDEKELDTFRKCYGRVFNSQSKEYYNQYSKCTHITVNRQDLEFLEVDRVLSGLKTLPEYFLRLNKRSLRFAIAKLIDFDGYIGKRGNINYCSKSKQLIDQVSLMMECLGVKTQIRKLYLKKYEAWYYEVYVADQRDTAILHEKLRPYSYKVRNFNSDLLIDNVFNYSRYTVPSELWLNKVTNLVNNSGYKWNELLPSSIINKMEKDITIDRLRKVLNIVGRNKELEFYCTKSTYWDEVATIEEVGPQNVYDFSMEFNCVPQAYANGLLVHNSMGKKKADVLLKYKTIFTNKSVENGYEKEEMSELWDTMEKFAGYAFNLAHAAAYGITGYTSQWLKANFPTEFWTTAFEFAKDTQIANYISEINQTGAIKIMPANINKSRDNVYTDFKNKVIYWPLISIKQCGEKAASQIIELRDQDGEYFTFEEFIQRNKFKGSKVTKQVIENLILSGAFDEIEHLGTFESRYKLILQYRKISKTKIDLEKDLFELDKSKLKEEWWWILQQKRLSGIAFFDYRDLTSRYLESDLPYMEMSDFQNESNSDTRKKVKIGGYITEVEERTSKKGKWARIKLENNYTFINVVVWAEQYKQIENLNLAEKEKSLLLITGQISNDSFHKENVLQANDDTELLILI